MEKQPELEHGLSREQETHGDSTLSEAAPAATAQPRVDVVRRIDDPPGAGRQLAVERVVVRQSEEMDKFFGALAAAQIEEGYGDIEKARRARVDSRRTGISYEYTYETLKDVLDATRPHLGKHGLAFQQFPFTFLSQGLVLIRTQLGHDSGQWQYTDLVARIEGADPQAVGSGITYLRRYAAKAVLGVSADDEDDDGQAASRAPVKPAQRKSEQPAATGSASPASGAKGPRPDARAPAGDGDGSARTPGVAPTVPEPDPLARAGIIVETAERDGAFFFKLDSGFVCATRNKELLVAAHEAKRQNVRVEFRCHGPKDPKFAATLDEIVRVK